MEHSHPVAQASESGRLSPAVIGMGLLALALVLAWSCFFAVDKSHYALVTEFGKPIRVIATPGLQFKAPYQSVRRFDNRLFVFTPAATEFLSLEKTPVVAAGAVLWRVSDARRFFQTVFDRAGAESRLADILFAELGAVIGRNPLTAFVSTAANQYRAEVLLAEVTARCRAIARRDYGIEVTEIMLARFDFPQQNRARVYARMASERGRISMKYRSEGDEEGTKVRAAAEREQSRILAEALKQAQQLRGEGEGEAARIYGEALRKGPEFYRFVRAMEASRNLVPKGTTLVLPADSELFGLLYDSNHYNARGARPGAKRAKEAAMR